MKWLANFKGVPVNIEVKRDDKGAKLGVDVVIHLILFKVKVSIGGSD